MILILHAIAIAIAGTAAPAAGECPLSDNHCTAKRYQREADQEGAPGRRALLYYSAHVAHLDHYRTTGDAADLCAARRALAKSLAVKDSPEQQRAHFARARPELAAIASRDGVRCDRGSKRSPGSSAVDVTPTTTATASDEVTTDATSTAGASTSTATPASAGDPDELLAKPASATAPSLEQADDPLLPATAIVRRPFLAVPPSTSDHDRRPAAGRPGRPLVIAGGVTLAAGVILAGVATYAGVRVADIEDQGFALRKNWDALDMNTRAAMDAELTRRWSAMYPLTLGTAIAGGVGIVVGAALLGEGRHRQIRSAAAQTALVPLPGGLALCGRF